MSPTPPPVTLTVGDAAVARIAADAAVRVPGVLALQADLGQSLLGVAAHVLHTDRSRTPTVGVRATVAADGAQVAVTVVTTLGHNCRDLAISVQRAVAAAIADRAGLPAVVGVTVADVIHDP